MWQNRERDAWLGPALEEMSGEQLEAFDDAARQIFDRYPATEDDPDAATEALSGALMVIPAMTRWTGWAAHIGRRSRQPARLTAG